MGDKLTPEREARERLARWLPRMNAFLRGENDGAKGAPWAFVKDCAVLLDALAETRAQSEAYEGIYNWVREHLYATCPADGCNDGPECLPCMEKWASPDDLRQLREPTKGDGDE